LSYPQRLVSPLEEMPARLHDAGERVFCVCGMGSTPEKLACNPLIVMGCAVKPSHREWIIDRWYGILDYDRKPSKKFDAERDRRMKAKLRRSAEDEIRARKKFANDTELARHAAACAEEERINPTPPKTDICSLCYTLGKSVNRTKGSFLVEIALWLLFCFPGVIYSLWRITSTEKVCARCGGQTIPVRTPRGEMMWRQLRSGESSHDRLGG